MNKKKPDLKVVIFGIVGLFNTIFDLILYIVLYNSSHSILIANTASTSAAIIGSYVLNSRYTFKNLKWTKKRFIGFVAVTLFGLWVLQTGFILAITPIIRHLPNSSLSLLGNSHTKTLKTALPKILAVVVTFGWNFVWYNKVIFKDQTKSFQIDIALDDL